MRKHSNFYMNYRYAKKYAIAEGLKIPTERLRQYVKEFTSWEREYVFSLLNGWETYRETVIWIDYDEVIEKYIDTMLGNTSCYYNIANSSTKNDYKVFLDCILPQIIEKSKIIV